MQHLNMFCDLDTHSSRITILATEFWEGATCSINNMNGLLVTFKVSICPIVRQIGDFSPIRQSGARQVAKLAKNRQFGEKNKYSSKCLKLSNSSRN